MALDWSNLRDLLYFHLLFRGFASIWPRKSDFNFCFVFFCHCNSNMNMWFYPILISIEQLLNWSDSRYKRKTCVRLPQNKIECDLRCVNFHRRLPNWTHFYCQSASFRFRIHQINDTLRICCILWSGKFGSRLDFSLPLILCEQTKKKFKENEVFYSL